MINTDITIQPGRRVLALGWIKYRSHQHNTLNVQGAAQASLDVIGALVIDAPASLTPPQAVNPQVQLPPIVSNKES